MEALVNKFSKGPSAAKMYQKLGDQSKSSQKLRSTGRSQSKDRKMTEMDRLNHEVERKLKLQRKQEKERIK